VYASPVRARREALGLSQRQLAERAGVSAGYIHQIESAERRVPAGDSGDRIARALKVSPQDLHAAESIARAEAALDALTSGPAAMMSAALSHPGAARVARRALDELGELLADAQLAPAFRARAADVAAGLALTIETAAKSLHDYGPSPPAPSRDARGVAVGRNARGQWFLVAADSGRVLARLDDSDLIAALAEIEDQLPITEVSDESPLSAATKSDDPFPRDALGRRLRPEQPLERDSFGRRVPELDEHERDAFGRRRTQP
jgi:transcriptional regulator with XRE-family HTH domain